MKLTRALGATAAASALALMPGVAHADTDVHTDFTGDVVSLDFGDEGEDWTPQPTRTEGDIVSTRVSHLDRKVRIKIRFAELSRTGRGANQYLVLRSDKGKRYLLIDSSGGKWAGRTRFTNANDDKVPCTGISHKIDYVANTVLAVVPRTCLGNPRWVRAGIGTITFGASDFFVDDARTQGNIYDNPVLGPRVRR